MLNITDGGHSGPKRKGEKLKSRFHKKKKKKKKKKKIAKRGKTRKNKKKTKNPGKRPIGRAQQPNLSEENEACPSPSGKQKSIITRKKKGNTKKKGRLKRKPKRGGAW